MSDHLHEDFLSGVFGRFRVLQEAEREVVDPAAVAVVDLGRRREVARLNDAHQLLIAQVLHLPCFSTLRRWHGRKVTARKGRGRKQERTVAPDLFARGKVDDHERKDVEQQIEDLGVAEVELE